MIVDHCHGIMIMITHLIRLMALVQYCSASCKKNFMHMHKPVHVRTAFLCADRPADIPCVIIGYMMYMSECSNQTHMPESSSSC